MSNYLLPYFGELDSKNLEEYYYIDIDFKGRQIQLDLNFENNSCNINRLEILKRSLEKLSEFDKNNKIYIEQDYADDSSDIVKTYIEHHLVEISKEELSRFIDFDNKITSPQIQLVNSLHLLRVGFYPDNESPFAIFDYSIGKELTQYLVVINTDENGKLDYMTMES